MPGECSICLSSFKEPVCIPCVIPDLTYLPKKYHDYVIPSLRRVYLDAPRYSDLKKELKASKEKIKKLENDNEILMQQCERHMAAANAQAKGERAARQKAYDLRSRLRTMEEQLHAADVTAGETINFLKHDIGVNHAQYQILERDYDNLRRRYEKLKARRDQADASTSTISIAKEHHSLSRKSRQSDLGVLGEVEGGSTFRVEREVRPLPARVFLKPKARSASPPPAYVNKRQRLASRSGHDNIEN
ncbi:hypothetical protein C0995_014941 [Termitomyces sp. Mi166|nr:hypothetical protein C0995_014941 [Termitomyces sp. Mi166\